MAPFSEHTTIGAFQAANNANGTYVPPPPPATANPYYQARFDGVQGYTHLADNTRTPFAEPQQEGAAPRAQPTNQELLGRPRRAAGGVLEGLHQGTGSSGGFTCVGTSAEFCCACMSADSGEIQYASDKQQRAVQPVRLRARGARRIAAAVAEAGHGNQRQGHGMSGDARSPHVYTPGDVAMVAAPQGRRRRNRSVEEYVAHSSKLADEWDDPAFSYNGGHPQAGGQQAGTGGLRHDLQDPVNLQQQPLLGPYDLVCSLLHFCKLCTAVPSCDIIYLVDTAVNRIDTPWAIG